MNGPTSKEAEYWALSDDARWPAAEKVGMVRETYEPGMTMSLVARPQGINPNHCSTGASSSASVR